MIRCFYHKAETVSFLILFFPISCQQEVAYFIKLKPPLQNEIYGNKEQMKEKVRKARVAVLLGLSSK
jgi:hypothetical protein